MNWLQRTSGSKALQGTKALKGTKDASYESHPSARGSSQVRNGETEKTRQPLVYSQQARAGCLSTARGRGVSRPARRRAVVTSAVANFQLGIS